MDFSAIRITIIINGNEAWKSQIKYSVISTKATNVSETVTALRAFKGLYDRTAETKKILAILSENNSRRRYSVSFYIFDKQ